jgi:allophanate hydrolase
LNRQLTDRGATLIRESRTAPDYRLFALPGTVPPKPGLLRGPQGSGTSIVVEVWSMPLQHYGSFVAEIPGPLGIGTLTLQDGSKVQGFTCEALATEDALDVSHHGGWRAYQASLRA